MIKPQPKTYQCLSCNWSKTVSPQSDVISPLDYFDKCPECGEKIETVPASPFDILFEKVQTLFK